MLAFFFLSFSYLKLIFDVDRYVASTTGRSHALGAHPGRSAHSSRTASSAASTPILRQRNNHRHHQIIRFNTRRLIIFHQRITNQHHNNQQQFQSTAEIPLVHRDNLLVPVNNQSAHHPVAAPGTSHLLLAHRRKTLSDSRNSLDSSAQMDGAAAHHMTMSCMDQEVSESSQTKNTSVMMSYL